MQEKVFTLSETIDKAHVLSRLEAYFAEWNFEHMGELKKYAGSTHYHITSNEPTEHGTIEITFSPSNKVIIKLASNRQGNWGLKAFEKLEHYFLYET